MDKAYELIELLKITRKTSEKIRKTHDKLTFAMGELMGNMDRINELTRELLNE